MVERPDEDMDKIEHDDQSHKDEVEQVPEDSQVCQKFLQMWYFNLSFCMIDGYLEFHLKKMSPYHMHAYSFHTAKIALSVSLLETIELWS